MIERKLRSSERNMITYLIQDPPTANQKNFHFSPRVHPSRCFLLPLRRMTSPISFVSQFEVILDALFPSCEAARCASVLTQASRFHQQVLK